jgi:signal transduction histidine kinase
VSGDRMRLRQALANLVDNAVKYTPPGGHIRLVALREPGQVVLECEDDGPGLVAEDLPRIWDRLYRGDRSRGQKGLGLGLSLVRAIATAHRGAASVSPRPGGGSVFRLVLPSTPVDSRARLTHL